MDELKAKLDLQLVGVRELNTSVQEKNETIENLEKQLKAQNKVSPKVNGML